VLGSHANIPKYTIVSIGRSRKSIQKYKIVAVGGSSRVTASAVVMVKMIDGGGACL
jgi:hypothetical protein